MDTIKNVGVWISPLPSYSREMYRAITAYARHPGRWNLHPVPQQPSADATCGNRVRLDGIIGYFSTDLKNVSDAKRLHIPIVNVSSQNTDLGLASVWPDNEGIGRTAAMTLMRLGLRHFAYFGVAGAHFSHLRQAGFTRTLRQNGLDCAIHARSSRDTFSGPGRRTVRRWLRSLTRPCGVLVVADSLTVKLMREAESLHLRIPEDLALLSVGNEDSVCPFCTPPLSSIPLPGHAMGLAAARLLDKLMHGKPPPGAPILVPVPMPVLRESTRIEVPGDAAVATAMRFIREQAPTHLLSATDIAEHVGQSRRTLDRRFRDVLRITPKEAIDQVRIEHLKWALRETGLMLKQISIDMRFSSPHHMARFFRRMDGTSPSAFRAAHPHP